MANTVKIRANKFRFFRLINFTFSGLFACLIGSLKIDIGAMHKHAQSARKGFSWPEEGQFHEATYL